MRARSLRSTISGCHEVDLLRISSTFSSVAQELSRAKGHGLAIRYSGNGSPVTSLDRKVNQTIRRTLPAPGEGWLSEESHDDLLRLQYQRVWIVDPIDGTRELLQGIPEWCVSIGLAMQGEIVAGGVFNPCTGEMFLGSPEAGLSIVLFNHMQLQFERNSKAKLTPEIGGIPQLLVSRKEYGEGKWRPFENGRVKITPVGSIAYRLALVAAGYADATCTFEPRSEWDIAAGVALVQASGGTVQTRGRMPVRFNCRIPQLQMLCAFSKHCSPLVHDILRAGTQ